MLTPTDTIPAGETNVIQVSSLKEAEEMGLSGYYKKSDIIDAVYVFAPILITPAVPVNSPSRMLWCDKCGKVTTQKFVMDWYGKKYVCDCKTETVYYVVAKGENKK